MPRKGCGYLFFSRPNASPFQFSLLLPTYVVNSLMQVCYFQGRIVNRLELNTLVKPILQLLCKLRFFKNWECFLNIHELLKVKISKLRDSFHLSAYRIPSYQVCDFPKHCLKGIRNNFGTMGHKSGQYQNALLPWYVFFLISKDYHHES